MLDWFRKQTSNEVDYNFYIRAQPENIDTSSTLTLTAFTSPNCEAAVPCHYKWYRIRNGIMTEASQFKGNSFICEPSDVGTILQAQITSNDRQHSGTAIVKYGPIKLDLMLKKPIEIALALGKCSLNAYMTQNSQQRECQITISDQRIKIAPINIDCAYNFEYSMSQPRLQPASKDPTKLSIVFNQKYEQEARRFTQNVFKINKLKQSHTSQELKSSSIRSSNQVKIDIRFPSRSSRDIFNFCAKAFNTKKQLKSSTILNKLQKLDFSVNDNFNYVLQIESLRSDILKMYEINKKINIQKATYQQQVKRLQSQMQKVVNGYLKIIQQKCGSNSQELNQNYSILSSKRDQIVSRNYQHQEDKNKNINDRLKALTDQVDRIRMTKLQTNRKQEINRFNVPELAFKKKSTIQSDQNIINLLDNLNQSQIHKRQSSQNKQYRRIEDLSREKEELQTKLQKSLKQIEFLQNKVTISHQNKPTIQFNYSNHIKPENTVDLQKLILENKQIKILNEALTIQNNQIKNQNLLIIQQNKQLIRRQNERDANQLIIKQQHQHFMRQNMKLNQNLKILQKKYCLAQQQTQRLINDRNYNQSKYKKRIADMTEEIEMFKKSQDALNRSQHISMEMDNYNQDQINMLKEQNLFLTNQNQKLAKVCERYMNDAKQSNKLKHEILQLKQQLNSKIDPQKQINFQNN